MNTNTMAHSNDPSTSKEAAESVDPHKTMALKLALIELLEEEPRNADEITEAYYNLAPENEWPDFTDHHNPKRRLSELHTRHAVTRESGIRRPSAQGKSSVVWELAISAEEAKQIVMAS